MDKRKIIRSPSTKRRSRPVPLNQRVSLERVIGLTVSSNATLATDLNTGTVAYPAGCVLVLFNPKRNRQTHIFNTSKKTITSIAFSPDGKHIVTGESGHLPAVRVWDVEEKVQVAEFHGHKFGIVCVKFSPNLKYIVSIGSQHDMMVNLWDWRKGTKVASNKVSSKVNSVAFSKDGSMFVTVGNRHVKFWYLDGSKSKIKNETVPLLGRSGILGEQKNNYFCDVALGAEKTAFVITQSGLLCQFNEKRNLEKWAELRTTSAKCISAGDDYIFVGCANGIVRVFNSHTLHYVTTLPHPHPLGVDVASAQSPSQMACQNPDSKFPDTVALVFNETFKKVTCVYNDHSLYMWDVHDVKRVGKSWSNLFHSSFIWGLEVAPPTFDPASVVLPHGSFITGSTDDTIRIWNIDPQMKETKYYKQNVYSHELLKVMYVDPTLAHLREVDYNPAGGTDKTDTNLESKNGIRSLCISPDSHHLASGDKIGNVRVHDLRDQTEMKYIEAHDQEVLCVQYSNIQSGPNLLASSGRDRLLHVYDVDQGYGTIQTLFDHSSTVTSVKFTDCDNQMKMLSSSCDKSVLFRNAQQSPDFQFVLGNQHIVGNNTLYDMDIDIGEKYVALACQDRNIRVYDIKSAKQKKCYKGTVGDTGALIRLQLDPSGQYVITSSLDKNLCILDFNSGELLANMSGHSDVATGVKFMNDLKHVVSVSGDSCIFVWRLPLEMTKQMQNRLQELGRLPMEAFHHTNNNHNPMEIDASLGRAPLFPNEQGFQSPSKILAELQRRQEEKEKEESALKPHLDFRNSVGSLPKWATAKSGSDVSSNQEKKTKHVPKGKWAKRVDPQGGPVIMSEQDQKVRKFQIRDESADSQRRETMVLTNPANTPRKVPIISTDQEEEDEGGESFKEEIIYPPSEEGTDDSVFTVFTGKEDFRKNRQGSLRNTDADSSSTDPVSIEDVEEEEEETPSAPATPCGEDVSTKAVDREKYFRDQYENMNFSPTSMEKFEKGLDNMEKSLTEDGQVGMFNARASISSKFLSKAQQANIRNMSVYGTVQRQDNWFDSVQRRKDEMARAVDETRKRLMEMGWKDESPDSPPDILGSGSTSPATKASLQGNGSLRLNHDPGTTSKDGFQMSVWDKPFESDNEDSTLVNQRQSNGSATRQSRPSTLSVNRSKRNDSEKTKTRYPLRSQSQNSLYRKSTESSKAKTVKTGVEEQKPMMKSKSITNVSVLSKSNSTQNLSRSSEKPKPPSRTKLKTSYKSSYYSSTPNLLGFEDTDEEDFQVSSNLKLCADINLSNSTPDLLDDDSVSLGSVSSDSSKDKSDSSKGKSSATRTVLPENKRFSTGTPSRISSNRADIRKSLPGRKLLSSSKANDKELMPPPSTAAVAKAKIDNSVSKAKQEMFIKRAMQTRRKTSELTLDQAKEILKGKSGILDSEKSCVTTNTTTTVSYISSSSLSVTTCSYSTSVSSSCSSSYLSPRNIPKVTTPPIHLMTNQILIESEIDSTAAEIRRQNLIDSAFQDLASLEAYPNDLPERDYTPSSSMPHSSPSVIPHSSSSYTSPSFSHSRPSYLASDLQVSQPANTNSSSSSVSCSDSNLLSNIHQDSDEHSTSVRERIAYLNAHSSPRISATDNTTVTSSVHLTLGNKQVSPGSCTSPRSSGVGSSLDSEMAARAFAGLSPPHDTDDVEKSPSDSAVRETIKTLRQTKDQWINMYKKTLENDDVNNIKARELLADAFRETSEEMQKCLGLGQQKDSVNSPNTDSEMLMEKIQSCNDELYDKIINVMSPRLVEQTMQALLPKMEEMIREQIPY